MFCIAAFIILGVIAIFSASFRPLAKKAWHCVLRRVTFRPCDIDFSEEMKGKLLGRIIVTHPKLARFLDRWIDWLAFAFVALSLWSLVYASAAGLYLFVYGTCNPQSVESCTLSAEACGVDQASPGLRESWRRGTLLAWVTGPVTRPLAAIALIPDRVRSWQPSDYVGPTPSYATPWDSRRGTAVEIVDPSCQFCRKLTANLFVAGVPDRLNLTYVLYPIPKGETDTKFPHSMLMARVIEATKRVPLPGSHEGLSGDWRLLKALFAPSPDGTPDRQTRFAIGFTNADAEKELRTILAEVGYRTADIERIFTLAMSDDVRESLAAQRRLVEEKVRTIRIPTLLIGNRRYDRVVTEAQLRTYGQP